MSAFIDNTEEVVLNELLRNYEQNRDGWLNSRDLSSKKKKELSLGLDLVYNELKQGTLTSRNDVREFVSSEDSQLSWARQSALGYLSELLDARPKSKPKEVDRYSNSDIKRQFSNYGWASSDNEINLNNWEALDYDSSTSSFTGTSERFKQMSKFLTTYKKSLKDLYNFEGSRYTDLKDLTDRIDAAIKALNSTETNTETKMDLVRQTLGAIGWSDADVNNLFRLEIPVESEEGDELEETNPVDDYTAAVNAYKLQLGWAELNAAVEALNAPDPLDLFAELWDTEIRLPYKNLKPETEMVPTGVVDNSNVLDDKFYTYAPWASFQTKPSSNLTPELLSQLSISLQEKLSNINADATLENQDIENIKLIYEKIKGSKSENQLKRVHDNSNEVYLDGFVFWNKGIYYSYDPNTKKLYRRRIMDNLNIYKDRYKQFESEHSEKSKYQGFFKKDGGVLKCKTGNYITYDFTPKSTPKPTKPATKENTNTDWESAGVTDFSNWTWRDWSVLGLILLDAGAIPASYAGPYGPLIGGGMGLLSTAAGAVNDFTDGNITWLDLKNLGVGIGADLVGLIPAWGDAATVGKILNGITKSAAITLLVSSIPAGALILDKHKRGEEITVQDMQFIASFLSGAAGFASNNARNRKTKKLNNQNNLGEGTEAPREHDIWFNDKKGFFTNWMKLLYQGSGPLSKGKKDTDIYYNHKTGKWINAEGVEVDPPKKAKTKPTTDLPEPQRTTDLPSQPEPEPEPQNTTVKEPTINDIPTDEVKAMRDAGYSDAQILKEYSRKKGFTVTYNAKGGTLEQLKSLRTGGVLKCETGAEVVSSFDRNNWRFFKDLLEGLGYIWDRKSKQFTKDGLVLNIKDADGNEVALNKSNYVNSDPFNSLKASVNSVREKLPQDLSYRNSTVLPEFGRTVATTNFNDLQAQTAADSIRDNIVLPQVLQYYGAQISNGMMDAVGYDQAISNITNTIASLPSADLASNRAFLLAGLSKISDLMVQKNQVLADNVKQSLEALIQLEKENQAARVEAANERNTILSSANKAIDDIYMASSLKNFNAWDNLAQHNIKSLVEQDDRYNELALQNLLNPLNKAMYDEIEALGPDASDADIMKIREKYSDLSSGKIAAFYGVDMPSEPFKLDWKLEKGGKVDRALQISKQMDKRYLAQLKNTNKQIDRLSKVTYKAILKSLGLK